MASLRLAFMGTPDFAVPIFETLADGGHEVVAAYTQPSRPAGRGQRPRPGPVAEAAMRRGIEVRTPSTLKDAEAQQAFAALDLDMAVVAAYGLILPQAVLKAPSLGCINVHASLLPRWRGAAPIQRAILAGDSETGVCIMQMEAGLDTGPVYESRPLRLADDETAGSLHDRLAELGAEMVVPAIDAIAAGLVPQPQADEGATYASKIDKAEARINWSCDAAAVDRLVRALSPYPGAWFEANGARIKVLKGAIGRGQGMPGLVLDDALTVACGKDAYRVIEAQRAGKAPMEAAELLRGFPITPGTRL